MAVAGPAASGQLDTLRAGHDLADLEVLPKGPGLLRIVVSGPAWLFGAWSGPAPRVRVHASSGHGAWQP